MNDAVPARMKNSREEMIRIALGYPEGLRVGNFTDGGTRFADEAYRVENGVGNALVTFEAFKVWGGEIHAIEVLLALDAASEQRNRQRRRSSQQTHDYAQLCRIHVRKVPESRGLRF